MSDVNLPPNLMRRLEAAEAEIRNLYRMRNGGDEERGHPEIVFSHAGKLIVSTSPRYYVSPAKVLRSIAVSLDTAGSSSTVVNAYKGTAQVAQLTLQAGVTFVRQVMAVTFGADADYLRFGVSTVGAGAKDLTCHARFSAGRPWPTSLVN